MVVCGYFSVWLTGLIAGLTQSSDENTYAQMLAKTAAAPKLTWYIPKKLLYC